MTVIPMPEIRGFPPLPYPTLSNEPISDHFTTQDEFIIYPEKFPILVSSAWLWREKVKSQP
jgi:hypothetical protein